MSFCGWKTLNEACMGCGTLKKPPETVGREVNIISSVISSLFYIHLTCQISVAEGPSQQERDHLLLLLTDAGSSGFVGCNSSS